MGFPQLRSRGKFSFNPPNQYVLSAESGSFVVSGTAATLRRGYALSSGAGVGSYSLTGTDASLVFAGTFDVTADPGAFTLTGIDATFPSALVRLSFSTAIQAHGYPRPFHPGDRRSVGVDLSTTNAITMEASEGTFALTGTEALLINFPKIVAAEGVFLLGLGEEVTFIAFGTPVSLSVNYDWQRNYPRAFHPSHRKPFKQAPPFNFVFVADEGAYTLTGSDVNFIAPVPALRVRSENLAWPRPFAPSVFRHFRNPQLDRANPLAGRLDKVVFAEVGPFVIAGADAAIQKGFVVAANAGPFILSGTAANFVRPYRVVGTSGSYTLGGTVAILRRGFKVPAVAGSYAVTGTDAALQKSTKIITADSGTYTLTGTAATLKYGHVLPAAVGSYTLTGSAASLIEGDFTEALPGSYVLVGLQAVLQEGHPIAANSGTYDLTGTTANLKKDSKALSVSGNYTLTGTATTLKWAHRFAANSGTYLLTGTAAGLKKGRTLDATAAGTYTWTGTAATLLHGVRVPAVSGNYLLTGQDAGAARSFRLSAEAGIYNESGVAAVPLAARRVAVQRATYLLTGTAAEMFQTGQLGLPAGVGSFSFAGIETDQATLLYGRKFFVDAAAYNLSGNDAGAFKGYVVVTGNGSFTWNGIAAFLHEGASLEALEGEYLLSGTDANFNLNPVLPAASGNYILTGTAANLINVVDLFELPVIIHQFSRHSVKIEPLRSEDVIIQTALNLDLKI